MHAVDTNVIIRYVTGDDAEQAIRARAVLGHGPVFVSKTVLLEAEWVLRRGYDLPAAQVTRALRAVAGLPGVSVEDAPLVARAMDWAEDGMDFADALHLAAAAECESFLTFDRRFARAATRLGAIPVAAP